MAAFLLPVHHCDRAPDAHTNVNVAILVESVDDESEDEANVAGVVISQIDDPSTGQNGG